MKFRMFMAALALLGAAIGFGLAGPSTARAQVDITMGGSSASDLLNDRSVEAICGGPGQFTRFTRTGSLGNNCPSTTAASIRAYTCTIEFCVGGTRAGLACPGGNPECPGGACGSSINATFRLSGFGSEFGVLPINGNCTDVNGLCSNDDIMVLDPTNCNINGGGNNDCACISPGVAVTQEDLGVSDVKGGSFAPPVPQPANSAAPVAVPFKFIIANDVETGVCNNPGAATHARNCANDGACGGGAGSCVTTRLSRLSAPEAQGIWAANIGVWDRICWNPDTYVCTLGTNANQPCNPNNAITTECPGATAAQCVNCRAHGPARPVRTCPRTITSGTRTCQNQIVHSNNGLPLAGGAGSLVSVFYPAGVLGSTAADPTCTDLTTQQTVFPFDVDAAGADGLCDRCPDLDGDDECDIVVREGTATGDVDNCVDAIDGAIGYIASDRFDSANWYAVGYDKALHSLEAMRNGSSALWCSLTYNKRPNATYATNELNSVNSVIDRVNTPAFLTTNAPAFSTDADMRVFKNLDRGPIQFKVP